MHIAVLCVGNITFCKKNCHALLLGKVSLISGTIINKWKKPSKPHETPVIDGVSGPCHIANLFGSKLDVTLNTHSSASRDSLLSSIQSSLSASHLSSVAFSEDDVFEAICLLNRNKSDISPRYRPKTESKPSRSPRCACAPRVNEHGVTL